MRISPSPVCDHWINSPLSWWWHRHAERGNVLRSAKFPEANVTSSTPAAAGLADAITAKQMFGVTDVAGLCAMTAMHREPDRRVGRSVWWNVFRRDLPSLPTDLQPMDQL